MSRVSGNFIKLGKETLRLCFLDLSHNNNPEALHTTKKQENIKTSNDR